MREGGTASSAIRGISSMADRARNLVSATRRYESLCDIDLVSTDKYVNELCLVTAAAAECCVIMMNRLTVQ